MKFTSLIAGCAVASTLCFAQAGFAYTAVTDAATESNAKGAGNLGAGAQIGDTFSVINGGFQSYLPGPGDAIIAGANPDGTGGDIGNYRFSLNGTVSAVNGNIVDYTGTYQIFYALGGGSTVSVSSGTATFVADFDGTSLAGPFSFDGNLHQTAGPGNPAFTGFANPNAVLTGEYSQSSPAGGTVTATIQSAPDATATFGLLGLSIVGLVAMKRREVRA